MWVFPSVFCISKQIGKTVISDQIWVYFLSPGCLQSVIPLTLATEKRTHCLGQLMGTHSTEWISAQDPIANTFFFFYTHLCFAQAALLCCRVLPMLSVHTQFSQHLCKSLVVQCYSMHKQQRMNELGLCTYLAHLYQGSIFRSAAFCTINNHQLSLQVGYIQWGLRYCQNYTEWCISCRAGCWHQPFVLSLPRNLRFNIYNAAPKWQAIGISAASCCLHRNYRHTCLQNTQIQQETCAPRDWVKAGMASAQTADHVLWGELS